jgi:pyruvate carboxylase
MEMLRYKLRERLCEEAVNICRGYGYIREGFLLAEILRDYWDEMFQRLVRESGYINLTNY